MGFTGSIHSTISLFLTLYSGSRNMLSIARRHAEVSCLLQNTPELTCLTKENLNTATPPYLDGQHIMVFVFVIP
jgi:hypothetical protein